jgi:GT2 family glycosyltransferase
VASVPVVLINSKDRKDELRRAIKSVHEQTVRTHLIIIDDASTDGTSDMVRAEFPEARLVTNPTCQGFMEARNHGARLALEMGSPIMFVLDDDAMFSTPRVVEQTLARLDHPRVGAVAIPLINFINGTQTDPDRFAQVCPGEFTVTFAFRGGASVMRADLFTALGGYQGHMGYAEENNYCARMINAGYVTRAGSGIDPINHYPSASRNPKGITRLKSINNLLFAWHNVPMPAYLVHSAGTWVNMARYGLKLGHLWPAIAGLFEGSWRSITDFGSRRPISNGAYRLVRALIKTGSMTYESVEPRLPSRRVFPGVSVGGADAPLTPTAPTAPVAAM